jgi:hypothetical protein
MLKIKGHLGAKTLKGAIQIPKELDALVVDILSYHLVKVSFK